MTIKLRYKALIFFIAPLLLFLILTFAFQHILQEAEVQLKQEAHAEKISALSAQLHSMYFEASYSSLISHLTGSEQQSQRFDELIEAIKISEQKLAELLTGNPEEVSMMRKARDDGEHAKEIMLEIRNGIPHDLGGTLALRKYQRKGLQSIKTLTEDYKVINDYCKALAAKQVAGAAKSRVLISNILTASAAAGVVLAVVLSIYFWKNISRRLEIITENHIRLASNVALHAPLPGKDEIAKLDKNFRRMADSLSEASRKERSLVDNAVSVLCSLDKDLKFTKVSAASEKLWLFNPDDLIGRRLVTILDESEAGETINLFQPLIKKGPDTVFDTRLIRKDKTKIDVRWNVFWSEAEQALFCVVLDVTQEKELQRLRQQLMDTVAHDLRNPLTSIQNTLNMLTMGMLGELPDPAMKRVTKTEREAERLIRLINDFLDFERLESGSMELSRAVTPMQAIVDDSVQALQDLRADVEIEIQPSETEALLIDADADKLVQVLVNILSNAIKFSPPDSKVLVSISAEGSDAKVSVIDQGPGIPKDLQSSIFERFKTIENRSKSKGSGLGLAIAKQLIELHDGHIGVFSEGGKGSTFWFTIPTSREIVDSKAVTSEHAPRKS